VVAGSGRRSVVGAVSTTPRPTAEYPPPSAAQPRALYVLRPSAANTFRDKKAGTHHRGPAFFLLGIIPKGY